VSLQEQIESFVDTYAPQTDRMRLIFIKRLREIMNEYALSAIEHGDIPEKGVPHKWQ
jgi:hypothetical protein